MDKILKKDDRNMAIMISNSMSKCEKHKTSREKCLSSALAMATYKNDNLDKVFAKIDFEITHNEDVCFTEDFVKGIRFALKLVKKAYYE